MKKKIRSFLIALRGDKLRAQYQKVEDALREKAEMASDVEFHRTMQSFYDTRSANIDPHVDWWGFADAKQKGFDHGQSSEKYNKKLEEASAKLKARESALAVLLNEEHD